jgi:hypothetical protein
MDSDGTDVSDTRSFESTKAKVSQKDPAKAATLIAHL